MLAECPGEIAVDLRKTRLDRQRLAKLGDRGVELSALGQDDAEVVVDVGAVGVRLDRAAVFDDRLVVAALLDQNLGEIAVGDRDSRA